MISSHRPALFLALLLSQLTACGVDVRTNEATSTRDVQYETLDTVAEQEATLSFALDAAALPADAKQIRVTLGFANCPSNPQIGAPCSLELKTYMFSIADKQLSIPKLKPGHYQIQLEILDQSGTKILQKGSGTADIVAGGTSHVKIALDAPSKATTGDLIIEICDPMKPQPVPVPPTPAPCNLCQDPVQNGSKK